MGDLLQHQTLPILCSSISERKAFSSLTHLTFWDPRLLMNHGWDHITFHLKIFRTSWLPAHSFPGFQSHADQVHSGFQTHPLFLSSIWSPPTPTNPNGNFIFSCVSFSFFQAFLLAAVVTHHPLPCLHANSHPANMAQPEATGSSRKIPLYEYFSHEIHWIISYIFSY